MGKSKARRKRISAGNLIVDLLDQSFRQRDPEVRAKTERIRDDLRGRSARHQTMAVSAGKKGALFAALPWGGRLYDDELDRHLQKGTNYEIEAQVFDDLLAEHSKKNLDLKRDGEAAPAEAVLKARQRPDPILRMVKDGHLEEHHKRAAREIAEVFEAITVIVACRGSSIDGASGSHPKGGRLPPSMSISEKISDWWTERYLPWSNVVDAAPNLDRRLVLLVAVEGIPVSEARRLRSMRHETAVAAIRNALELYHIICKGHVRPVGSQAAGRLE